MIHLQKLMVILYLLLVLGEEIEMLDVYLQNLEGIMRKFRALPQVGSIVDDHGKVLEKREKNK